MCVPCLVLVSSKCFSKFSLFPSADFSMLFQPLDTSSAPLTPNLSLYCNMRLVACVCRASLCLSVAATCGVVNVAVTCGVVNVAVTCGVVNVAATCGVVNVSVTCGAVNVAVMCGVVNVAPTRSWALWAFARCAFSLYASVRVHQPKEC